MKKVQKNPLSSFRLQRAKQGIRMIILIWLLLAGFSHLQAQSAGDIDTLSQWRVDMSYVSSEPTFEYYKYFISGTETIDSIEYFKIFRSGYQQYYWSGETYYYSNQPAGTLREEDNKWYTHNPGHDVLLFDFNLDVGDTVISPNDYWNDIIIVDSVGLITINGEDKKQIYFTGEVTGGSSFIIEDIGASTGLLFEPIINYFETAGVMHCYAIDFVPIWLNPEGWGCDLYVGVEEPEKQSSISTYPNPFSSFTTIEYETFTVYNVQFTIYNIQGVVVYETEERLVQAGTHKVSWSPSHLPGGMYYAVMRSEEGISVIKIIKQ